MYFLRPIYFLNGNYHRSFNKIAAKQQSKATAFFPSGAKGVIDFFVFEQIPQVVVTNSYSVILYAEFNHFVVINFISSSIGQLIRY
jgi:hypothetical protein